MVGHKVDDGLEFVFPDAFEQGAEFVESLGGVGGVIRADVKVVTDGIGGTCLALDEQGVVRGSVRVGCGARLLKHPGQPHVGDAKFAQ